MLDIEEKISAIKINNQFFSWKYFSLFLHQIRCKLRLMVKYHSQLYNDLIFIEAIVAYLPTVFTSSGRELEVGVGREMKELTFSLTNFPSRKDLIVIFLLQIFFPLVSNIRQYK